MFPISMSPKAWKSAPCEIPGRSTSQHCAFRDRAWIWRGGSSIGCWSLGETLCSGPRDVPGVIIFAFTARTNTSSPTCSIMSGGPTLFSSPLLGHAWPSSIRASFAEGPRKGQAAFLPGSCEDFSSQISLWIHSKGMPFHFEIVQQWGPSIGSSPGVVWKTTSRPNHGWPEVSNLIGQTGPCDAFQRCFGEMRKESQCVGFALILSAVVRMCPIWHEIFTTGLL